MTKVCSICGIEKDLSLFYKHPEMRDGFQKRCKLCCIEAERMRRITKPDFIHEYERRRSKEPKRKEHLSRVAKNWNEKYPERYKAHYLLTNAVRDGRIKKSPTCEICGKGGKIHGHHTDYSRPLEVVWLCAQCHGQIQ